MIPAAFFSIQCENVLYFFQGNELKIKIEYFLPTPNGCLEVHYFHLGSDLLRATVINSSGKVENRSNYTPSCAPIKELMVPS